MALDPTLLNFRALYPEFGSVADARIQLYIDIYTESLSETNWEDCFGLAVIYRSAHELALSQNREANASVTANSQTVTASGAGAITQASAGQISVSYAETATQSGGSDNDAYLSQTQYGQQYLALKRQCLAMGIIAGCQ